MSRLYRRHDPFSYARNGPLERNNGHDINSKRTTQKFLVVVVAVGAFLELTVCRSSKRETASKVGFQLLQVTTHNRFRNMKNRL